MPSPRGERPLWVKGPWLDNGSARQSLPGAHNAANLTAAIVAAGAAGLSPSEMEEGLKYFTPSPHRSRLVEIGGVRVLDDAYNANPSSMHAAVGALLALPGSGRNMAVLGLMAELGPRSEELHRQVGAALTETGLDLLLAVGEEAAALAEGFAAGGCSALHMRSRGEAVDWLFENTLPGDRVLVKGSRAAGLEIIVRDFEKRIDETPNGDRG